MAEAQGITNMGFRVVLDVMEDTLGRNGKNALLNYTKLSRFISDPPDYDAEKRIPIDEYQRFWSGVRIIIGNAGYNSLVYRAGVELIDAAIVHNAALKALVDMDMAPDRKLLAHFGAYLANLGVVPDKAMEHFAAEHRIVIHRPDCNECFEVSMDREITKDVKKAGCAFVVGAFFRMANIRPDIVTAGVVETSCKLLGDPECVFEIIYRAAGG